MSPSAAAVAAHPSPYFQVEGQDAALPTTWDGVCEWVMGRRPPLWDEVFESAFQLVSSPRLFLITTRCPKVT